MKINEYSTEETFCNCIDIYGVKIIYKELTLIYQNYLRFLVCAPVKNKNKCNDVEIQKCLSSMNKGNYFSFITTFIDVIVRVENNGNRMLNYEYL